MKPIKSLLLVGLLAAIPTLAPSEASAQPGGYYGPGGPPPDSRLPGGFWNRQNRLIFGFSGGVGGMHDDVGPIGDSTVAGMISGHIGGFIGPRFALMFEAQANIQQLGQDDFGGSVSLVQGAAMVAAQYWLTPQLWVKGGIGVANLQIQDEFGGVGEVASNGLAVMGGVGFELFSARYMSVDLQGRIINGSYDSTSDNITSATVGIGINWF
jgi:hypothetical protein